MEDSRLSAAPPGADSRSGRSCVNCSKAKAKCVRLEGQSSCHRCHRLKKDCTSREPVQRKRRSAKLTRAAQLENLEHKLENLVNVLATSRADTQGSHGQPSPPVSQASAGSEKPTEYDYPMASDLCEPVQQRMNEFENELSSSNVEEHVTLNIKHVHDCLQSGEPAKGKWDMGVSISEANKLLTRYRNRLAPDFPFVVIPEQWSVKELNEQKPFLCRVVITVSYYQDLTKQRKMVRGVLEDLSKRTLLGNEKTIDLLQGLLVFAAWYHPHLFAFPQISNIVQLAIALAVDLGLSKPPNTWDKGKMAEKITAGTSHVVHGAQCSFHHKSDLDDHRALAGLFYTTSMLSSCFKKTEAIRYSRAIEDALAALEQANEYPSDKLLISLVRLQRLVEDIHTIELPSIPSARAPATMYMPALTAEIQSVRKATDPSVYQNKLFLMQYHTAQLHAYELCLSDLPEEMGRSTSVTARLDNLFLCHQALTEILEAYFSIPAEEYLNLPFSVFGQFAHAFIVLAKLATLEVPGWDVNSLPGKLDFAATVEEAATRFEQTARIWTDGVQVSNDWSNGWAKKLRWLRNLYAAKQLDGEAVGPRLEQTGEGWKPPVGDVPLAPTNSAMEAQQPTPPDDIMSGNFFDYLDENFWQEFPGDNDLGFLDVAMQSGNGDAPPIQAQGNRDVWSRLLA